MCPLETAGTYFFIFMRGKLFFKYGCMGSGKSLHLLATAHNFQIHSIPFVIFKSEIDDRDGENVIHSSALGDRECVSIKREDNLYKTICDYLNSEIFYPTIKWILVDEAQFLTAEQVDQLAAIVDVLGISVICYGLRTDFQTHLFEGSKRLFEVADTLEEIKSSCYCNHKTIFNARMNSNKEIVTNGNQVEIGGDDKYVSICRKCYYEKTGNKYYINNDEIEE